MDTDVFYILILEVYFGVVVTALEQFFHLSLRRTTRVRARASVADCVLGNLRESLEEDVLRHEALLARVAVCAVVLDAVRDIEVVVHLAEVSDEGLNLFAIACALFADAHIVRDYAVTLSCNEVLCVECDNLRQVHCVCRAVDNVRTVVGESRTRLVSH